LGGEWVTRTWPFALFACATTSCRWRRPPNFSGNL
jgi:hypothetical protein